MGNVSDKLENSPNTSTIESSNMIPSGSPGETSLSVEWFDAPESLNTPSRSVVVALKVVNGVVECVNQQGPLSPVSVQPPPTESRSPTSRFRASSKFSPKKRTLISRLTPYEKRLFFKKVDNDGNYLEEEDSEEDEIGEMPPKEEQEKEEHLEDPANEDEEKREELIKDDVDLDLDLQPAPKEASVTGLCPSTPLSVTPDVLSDIPSNILLESSSSPPPEAPPTNNNLTDADMKRQKKRDRKKTRQLNKEQQLRRDRLQRMEAIKQREERERKELAAVAIAKEAQKEETKEKETKKVYNYGEFVPPVPKKLEEIGEDETDGKKETLDLNETFEVCVDGERKLLREFTPRSKQNSVSQESSSSNLIYGMPEHEPVVVPFNERPMVVNYNFHQPPPQHMPPMYRQGPPPPPPPYVQPPPPMPPQFMMPQPQRYLVVQHPPPPPPPFVGLVQVPVMPMQRAPMHGPPMPMVNHHPPMFHPPQNQGMPMQHNPMPPRHQQQQHHQMPRGPPPPPPQPSNTVYASQRQLVRPVRNPLPITAPEEAPSTSQPQQSSEVVKEEEKLDTAEEKKEEETAEPEDPPAEENVEEEAPATFVVEETIIMEGITEPLPEAPLLLRRGSSVELNGDLITSGVAAVLDESDEEFPPISGPPLRPLSPNSLRQLASINRVFDYSKHPENSTYDIWTGFVNEMPSMRMPYQMDTNFQKMLTEDEKTVLAEKEAPTLVTICKSMEHYFMNSRAHWSKASVDGDQLSQMFILAYGGSIPSSHWRILERVCRFEPGYFHVFDTLIGSTLELSYNSFSVPEKKRDIYDDELYRLYQSLPPVDGEDQFFHRFEEKFMPDLLNYLSDRFITVRTFVAIAEIVKGNELSVSDLYYLASLIYGSRQFFKKFNVRIEHLEVEQSAGKRWIRQATMDEPRGRNGSLLLNNEARMTGVSDFVTRLKPYIGEILQVLPDGIIDHAEFFKQAKLICGWEGPEEERIWKSMIKDKTKFQDFCDAYIPYLRMERRADNIYFRKQSLECFENSDEEEAVRRPMKVVAAPYRKALTSAIKTGDSQKPKKKSVSYADKYDLVSPSPPAEGHSHGSTQTDHLDMDQIWDLERRVIRLLMRDNTSFIEFIETDNAREMHQFLIDTFKSMNLRYFAFILEKAMAETHEKAWQDTFELRQAAEEARRLLEKSREEHKIEIGSVRSKMETISRFEAFEVQAMSNSRIDALKERICELKQDRELLLREEVKEERARMQRQLKEMKEKHNEEKREYLSEMTRLREEVSRLRADREELEMLRRERVETAARCEDQMIKAKEMCANSTKLLQETRLEMEALRHRKSLETIPTCPTPDPQRDCEPDPQPLPDILDFVDPSIPSTSTQLSSPIKLSSAARLQLKMTEKYAAEFHSLDLRTPVRELVEWYNTTGANHKERKTAEKQLKEYEAALDSIENAIKENLQMLKLNVVEGLHIVANAPMPFSEKVLQKMLEYRRNDSEEEEEGLSSDDEDGCLICTEAVEAECETVTCDTCLKEYHYHCISQWLKINSVCPACSRALKDPNEYPRLE